MDLIEIARMEEGRHARALTELADQWRPFGGGTAARGEAGSWINSAVGMGLSGPVSAAELDDVIEWYVSAGIEPRLEFSPFADDGLRALLEKRGFVVRAFENVFFCELDAGSLVPLGDVRGLSIQIVDKADPAAVREAALVAMSGFLPPGMAPSEFDIAVSERIQRRPRAVGMVARLEGKTVAAGTMAIDGMNCVLFGMTVLEPYRRRGIQQAMISARLAEAARRGARLATISSHPGISTERNVRRMGFNLAYTKVVLCKPGPGLAPAVG